MWESLCLLAIKVSVVTLPMGDYRFVAQMKLLQAQKNQCKWKIPIFYNSKLIFHCFALNFELCSGAQCRVNISHLFATTCFVPLSALTSSFVHRTTVVTILEISVFSEKSTFPSAK